MNLLNGEKLTLGTCYYPEHWPETMWGEDLRRMLENGIEVIRIAEFAWNKVEPTEGTFTFDFFDRFLDVAEKMGMKVIFCTPTATPPAWLTEKYPEVLNARIDGVIYRHGGRRHYNYNSPVYQEKAALITERFAEHFAHRPCIIGWQIDNEINCETDVFYSKSDDEAFRVFVKEKYGTLDALNDAWGTVFWNQTYSDWSEVHIPRPTVNNVNIHLLLDYTRFVSHSARGFVKLQSDILRRYLKPGDFITTNGIFSNVDNHAMNAESLDFMMYDSYPNFANMTGGTPDPRSLRDRNWSRHLTEVRSISPIFGIMEQQSGANGQTHSGMAPTPKPGQITLWTMQSVAHGADYVSYFRWRTCTFGTEIYWHGILDYSSRDNRRLREVKEVHKKFQALGPVAGAHYEAKVAVIKDFDNIWNAQEDAWHRAIESVSSQGIYAAAQHTHTPVDFVYLTDDLPAPDLSRYSVIFYPHPMLADKARAELLQRYVENGGTLVLGCRSGIKDRHGRCVMDLLPGVFRELTGADVPEYTPVGPEDSDVVIDWEGEKLKVSVFSDELDAIGEQAEVLGRYENCYYAGTPGLLVNRVGKGSVYSFGTTFPEETAAVFLRRLGVAEPYRNVVEVPECCEIAVREKDGHRFYFVLNYSAEPAEIVLGEAKTDLYTGETVQGRVQVEPYGTRVYG